MLQPLVNFLKNVYTTPSAEIIARKELEEAKRKLLEAQTGKEYAESMCKYHEARIKRLTTYLHSAHE